MTTRSCVVVIQAGAVPFDSRRSMEKAADLAAQAAREGAKLVVFPEALVGGYRKGLDFVARVEENVAVTPDGVDVLTAYPRELRSL